MSENKVNQIPNIITGINLISGCIAIFIVTHPFEEVAIAAYLIFLASIFDFLDGLFARILKAVSSFGKIFDSIVDIVSFGVAPTLLMFKIMTMSLTYNKSTFDIQELDTLEYVFLFSPILLTVFAAIRLARFTSSDKESEYFRGLPTPACAILIASLAILSTSELSDLHYFIFNNTRLLILIICVSILMVINLPMMKLKFQNGKIRDNFIKYLFILGSVILFIVFQIAGIPLIIILYIILSIVNTLLKEPNL